MKVFLVNPVFELQSTGPETDAYLDIATEILCNSLRARGDVFHRSVIWRDPGRREIGATLNIDFSQPKIVDLSEMDVLARSIRRSLDPYDPFDIGVIRSIATCRAVTFGYDGQAILCLRHEDAFPYLANSELAEVSVFENFLEKYDLLDGFCREI